MKRIFCLIILLISVFTLGAQEVLLSSGSYSSDQIVRIRGEGDYHYYFGESVSGGLVPYTRPLYLSALKGESRTYTLHIGLLADTHLSSEQVLTYIIDKQSPAVPEPSFPEGSYQSDLRISFSKDPDSRVVYSLGGPWVEWDGTQLLFKRPGEYLLQAYAIDEAGNQSPIGQLKYRLGEKKQSSADAISILSPVAGTFANPQLLVIEMGDFDRITYTIDESEPTFDSRQYTAPVEINALGQVRLQITGFKNEKPVDRKEVVFSVLKSAPGIPHLDNGVFSQDLTIPLPGILGRYTTDDSRPDESSRELGEIISFSSIPGGVRYVPLTIRQFDGQNLSIQEYRYFYVMDNRIPGEPHIEIGDQPPLKSGTTVQIYASAFSEIYYTLDGSSPDRGSTRYTSSFPLEIPASGTGSVMIKARSFGSGGEDSSEISRLVTFDTDIPAPPQVVVDEKGISLTSEYGSKILFTVSIKGEELEIPDSYSPVVPDPFELSVPHGINLNFFFMFIAIDNAGNMSEPVGPVKYSVNTIPPPVPDFTRVEDTIIIGGGAEVRYSLTDDGSIPATPGIHSPLYTGPIPLAAPEGERRVYRISAVSVAGSESQVSGPFSFIVDRRKADTPKIVGVEDGAVYNQQAVTVYAADGSQILYYTSTEDGTIPGDPNMSSPVLDERLTFFGTRGAEKTVTLKILSAKLGGAVAEEPVMLRFTIDLNAPDPPTLLGFEDGGFYNHPIFLSAADCNDSVYIVYSTEDDPGDPFGPEGLPLIGEKTFDVDEGAEVNYYLRAGARDTAGNSTISPDLYSFTIDKKAPDIPEVLGIPAGGFTNTTVSVSLEDTTNLVYYELDEGIDPPSPDETSGVFPDSLKIEGIRGETASYVLKLRSRDQAGNFSRKIATYQFTIDLTRPDPPKPPVTTTSGNNLILSWTPEYEMYIKIEGIDNKFRRYQGPVSIPQGDYSVSCYAVDPSGNRSSTEKISLNLLSMRGRLVSGAEDGGLYSGTVELTPLSKEGILRYEIAVYPRKAKEVTPFSPVCTDTLLLRPYEGEELTYHIKLKLYRDDQQATEEELTFVLDNNAPDPPVIIGLDEDSTTGPERIISFKPQNATIYYRLGRMGASTDLEDDFTIYTDPFTLLGLSGTLNSYSISAYSVDKAGNRSVVTSWTAYIDQEIVYVSSRGNDELDGARKSPYRTLEKAVAVALEQGKSTIFLSEGTYFLNCPLEFKNDLMLVGGFESDSWNLKGGETIIKPGKLLSAEYPFLTHTGGTLTLQNLSLLNDGATSSSILVQKAGNLIVGGCNFKVRNGKSSPILEQSGGSSILSDTTFRIDAFEEGALIYLGGIKTTLDGVTISAGFSSNLTALEIKDTEVSLSECIINPGVGTRTTAIEISGGVVDIRDTEIETGSANASAFGIIMEQATLTMTDSTINGDEHARMITCFQAEGSNITLNGNTFFAEADRGIIGMQINGSSCEISDNEIFVGDTEEFIYLVLFSNSRGLLTLNRFATGDTGDYLGIRLSQSQTRWYNNTIIHGEGRRLSTGIQIRDSGSSDFRNNIFTRDSETLKGTALITDNFQNIQLLSNIFYGFQYRAETGTEKMLSILELNRADGDPFGGRIDRNLVEPCCKTFSAGFRLSPDSAGVNRGIAIPSVPELSGKTDIGANEVSE